MKMQTLSHLLLMLAAITAIPSAHGTSLLQVWQLAKLHAPALVQAEATLSEAQAAHSAALANLMPSLNLNASRVVDNQSSSGPEFYGSSIVPVTQASNARTNGWDLELDQPLFNWQAIQNLSAADYSEAAGVATAEAARQTLMATLTQDYLAVLNAQAQLDATREAEHGFDVQATQAAARYQAGLSGIIGTDETQAALAQAQAETLAAEQSLRQAHRTLDTDTGVPVPGPFPELPATAALHLPPTISNAAWLRQALAQNPTLAAARLNQNSAGHALSAAQSGYLPAVSLVLSHQRNFVVGNQDFSVPGSILTSPANQDSSQNLIGVQLSWAIFSGGATSAASQTAEAQEESADATTRTTELTVRSQVNNALDGLESANKRVQQLRTGVTSAQAAVNATAAAVAKGLNSEQDLVIARQTLLSLKTAYAQAVVDLMTNRVALAQALGTLSPALLSDLSKRLESNQPYQGSNDTNINGEPVP
ncbi:MAG: TolC family protein [Gammaproteobacteria bacterium]